MTIYESNTFKANHNTDQNGLEISYKNKMTVEQISELKQGGFRWSRRNQVWYQKWNGDEQALSKQLINSLIDKDKSLYISNENVQNNQTSSSEETLLKEDVISILVENDINITPTDVKIYKPEEYGFEKDDKLHVLVEFNGNTKEDWLLDVLQQEHSLFNGQSVDWNPISTDISGTIAQYLENLKTDYQLAEKFNKNSNKDEQTYNEIAKNIYDLTKHNRVYNIDEFKKELFPAYASKFYDIWITTLNPDGISYEIGETHTRDGNPHLIELSEEDIRICNKETVESWENIKINRNLHLYESIAHDEGFVEIANNVWLESGEQILKDTKDFEPPEDKDSDYLNDEYNRSDIKDEQLYIVDNSGYFSAVDDEDIINIIKKEAIFSFKGSEHQKPELFINKNKNENIIVETSNNINSQIIDNFSPEDLNLVKAVTPSLEYETILENSINSEEKIHFKTKINEIAKTVKQLQNNSNGMSYNSKTRQHDKGYIHYFLAGNDWYICELDKNAEIGFGFAILNGDTQMAEYGDIIIKEVTELSLKNGLYNVELDLYTDQSLTMEQAICKIYPELKIKLLSGISEDVENEQTNSNELPVSDNLSNINNNFGYDTINEDIKHLIFKYNVDGYTYILKQENNTLLTNIIKSNTNISKRFKLNENSLESDYLGYKDDFDELLKVNNIIPLFFRNNIEHIEPGTYEEHLLESIVEDDIKSVKGLLADGANPLARSSFGNNAFQEFATDINLHDIDVLVCIDKHIFPDEKEKAYASVELGKEQTQSALDIAKSKFIEVLNDKNIDDIITARKNLICMGKLSEHETDIKNFLVNADEKIQGYQVNEFFSTPTNKDLENVVNDFAAFDEKYNADLQGSEDYTNESGLQKCTFYYVKANKLSEFIADLRKLETQYGGNTISDENYLSITDEILTVNNSITNKDIIPEPAEENKSKPLYFYAVELSPDKRSISGDYDKNTKLYTVFDDDKILNKDDVFNSLGDGVGVDYVVNSDNSINELRNNLIKELPKNINSKNCCLDVYNYEQTIKHEKYTEEIYSDAIICSLFDKTRENIIHNENDISTNFVLNKLQAAGIEVVTDKTEFDRILESEKDLQKMIDEFDKLNQKLSLLEEESNKEKNKLLLSQEEEIKYLENEVSKFSDEINDLKQFIPELEGDASSRMTEGAILVKQKNIYNYYLGKQFDKIVYYYPDFQVYGESKIFFNFSKKEFGYFYNDQYFIEHHTKEYVEKERIELNARYIERMKSLLNDKDLLITSIKKNLEKEIQSKSIEISQLKERTIQQKYELNKENNSKDIATFKKLSNVLRTGEEEIINNPTLGEVEIRFGGKNYGLAHIILRRIEERTHRTENRESLENATKNVTSILYLINKAIENSEANRTSRGNWNVEINGIKAVIDKDADGKYVLTGFDNKQKKEESTEAIKAVIAQYGTTPEFLEMYAQVGAVYSSYTQNISEIAEKSSEFMKINTITYGFAHEGKIYLDPEIMNSNVAVHEYTHLWDKYTQNTNPDLWEKGKTVFSKTHLWEDVKNDPNYANIASDDDLILSECHARICGAIAEKVLQNIAERDGEIAKDAVIDWDKEVSSYISESLTKDDKVRLFDAALSVEDIKQFLSQPMKDLMAEKNITLEQQKQTLYFTGSNIQEVKYFLTENSSDFKLLQDDTGKTILYSIKLNEGIRLFREDTIINNNGTIEVQKPSFQGNAFTLHESFKDISTYFDVEMNLSENSVSEIDKNYSEGISITSTSNQMPLSFEDKEAITHIGTSRIILEGNNRFQIYMTESSGIKTLNIDKNHQPLFGDDFEKIKSCLGLNGFNEIVKESNVQLKISTCYTDFENFIKSLNDGKKVIAVPFYTNGYLDSKPLYTYCSGVTEASKMAKLYIKQWDIPNTKIGKPYKASEEEINQLRLKYKTSIVDEYIKILKKETKKYNDKLSKSENNSISNEPKQELSSATVSSIDSSKDIYITSDNYVGIRKNTLFTPSSTFSPVSFSSELSFLLDEDFSEKKILSVTAKLVKNFTPDSKIEFEKYLKSLGANSPKKVIDCLLKCINVSHDKNLEVSKSTSKNKKAVLNQVSEMNY